MAMIRKNILHKLARETRQSIFDDVLAMDPNGSCPTLLIALVNDKYYDEAVCRYKKFNQAVSNPQTQNLLFTRSLSRVDDCYTR